MSLFKSMIVGLLASPLFYVGFTFAENSSFRVEAIPQLAEATAQAPTWAKIWYQGLRHSDPNIVGLGRLGGGTWCAFSADVEQTIVTTRCLTADGAEVSLEDWHQKRKADRAEVRGAMSAELDLHLQQADTNEPVSAMIWARHEPPIREGGLNERIQVVAVHKTLRQSLYELCKAYEDCIAYETSVDGPMVEIVASAETLRSLAREPLVGAIDYLDPDRRVEADQAPGVPYRTMECIRIDEADSAYSANGSGITIGVIEGGVPPAAILSKITSYVGSNCAGAAIPPQVHASEVMSVIQANSDGARTIDGSALEADIIIGGIEEECYPCSVNADCRGSAVCNSSGYCSYTYFMRTILGMEWAANQGAQVINLSQGEGSTYCDSDAPGPYWGNFPRFIDYYATQYPYPVITASSGNQGANKVSKVAYNALIVGGSQHNDSVIRSNHTVWDSSPCVLSPYSEGLGAQARNALGLDSLEVPHVVAPAKQVATLKPLAGGTVAWTTQSGTSYAAPHVAGVAARLLEINKSKFEFYPEAVRAVIMASASQDVDGGALNLLDSVDDRGGTGEVDAYEAERVALAAGSSNCWGTTGSPCSGSGVNRGQLLSSDFSLGSNYYHSHLYFRPTSGSRARIVLHWMNNMICTPGILPCTGGPDSPMTLMLSLWKFNPNTKLWGLAGLSAQPNPEDNYLYIQTSITANDLYRISFNYPGKVAGRSTYYGLAWMTR